MIALLLACVEPSPSTPTPSPLPPLPALVINEVQASNVSTLRIDGAAPDWIELYNADAEPVDLARVTLEDDNAWRWPVGEGELAPGGRLFLIADPAIGDVEFAIGAQRDRVVLRIDDRPVDAVEIRDARADTSIARFPDGGAWSVTARPSPGLPNGDAPTATDDPADVLLSRDQVWRIDLTITAAGYTALNQSVWSQNRVTVPAVFEMDGVVYPEVGLRMKGSASADALTGKPALKIDFNHAIPGERFRGLKALNLHNGNVFDPTRARDHLTYLLARDAGLAAPRVGWADLYMNDVHLGLYILVENHDDEMIDHHFPGLGEGSLLVEPNRVWWDFGMGNPAQLLNAVEHTPDPPNPVHQQIVVDVHQLVSGQATDERIAQLWELVDQENLVTYTAWEMLVGHTDGYSANNNWRFVVVGDEAPRLHLVPCGAEWTWETNPAWPSFGGRLMQFCHQNTGCKREVAVRLIELADRIDALDLEGEFEAVNEMLTPYILADPRSPHTAPVVVQTRNLTRTHLRNNGARARALAIASFPDLAP